MKNWLNQIHFNEQGLIPAIAQEMGTGKVLMLAWMNQEALKLTVEQKRAVYWSRSRGKLWAKGEESGHVQQVKDIRLDCDNDVILLTVEQVGGVACHTGRHHCFFQQLQDEQWVTVEPVLKDPSTLYNK
ncbi:MAG: phosphoribosyl-AMP cyclohydrolase [Candidatus Parabeggiatoa sp. nov. 3]|jgi:phosphoribosyl-AMP cyclohydrolase|nr:MAG: phosphoribosyl-AMP cyclohydrolase [Gammaproteobacteria bacterium]RKZ66580.1 MAG: phosphoribosyl-AMP cyclohydrolase [Gammaproteobacteria bacterium]RKZ83832.1 MAG: phosphoribosyl-AMP cyclohydrolase [Gammaproteobacteria bacterium]